jgi:choline-sulfatase
MFSKIAFLISIRQARNEDHDVKFPIRSSPCRSLSCHHTMSVSQLFENGKKPNLLLIITDQERSLQHWPESFTRDHLPSMCRLQKNGLEFQNYFTNSCMCSPSRATLLTSQFPVKTGVTTTGSPEPRVKLPTDIVNFATLLQQAGYHVEWHGKWHLGGHPSDYGFAGWEPPDAGNYLILNETLGGGDPNNDGRFLEEACHFLDRHAATKQQQPFCLVTSFVNPHDVYVAQHDPALGYTRADFAKVHVPLPENWQEDPDTNDKPRAQAQMSIPYVRFENEPQDYVNFYAYLHTIVDAQIGRLLDKFDALQLTESTLIVRTADHGEQALSHSLVEKFYNAYEESIHIPMIVSNPLAYPVAQQTSALASHVDILPTLAHLLGLEAGCSSFVGQNLTPTLDNPCQTVQSKIHFTYDDIPCRDAPSIIRCLRTARYKYAVYLTPDGSDADWELYDLQQDPLENENLAGSPKLASLQQRLDGELVETMKHNGTLPSTFQWPPRATKHSRGGPPLDS